MTSPLENMDDGALIASFLRGGEAAFEVLYRRHRGALYAFLTHLAGDSAEADEVFSETWLRALEKLPKYRDDGKFDAWLFRIGRNYYLDRCRARQRRRNVSLDDETPPSVPANANSEPHTQSEAKETGELISAALRKLPAEQREVFLLRQQDVAFKEIAAIQRTSVNTVLSRMQYALRALRRELAEIDH